MHPQERGGTFHLAAGNKMRKVTSMQKKPMIHHYSWVRAKEALLRKATCWGHRDERNWKELIEIEFSRAFSGSDFVHGYSFIEVEPYLKPGSYPITGKNGSNVIYLSTSDIHKIDLELKFNVQKV